MSVYKKYLLAVAALFLLSGCGGLEWDGSSIFGNPLGGSSSTTTSSTNYAVVGYNETLSQVASRYGVSAEALAKANNLSTNAQLTQGQYLRLPSATSIASAPVVSTAENVSGDLQTVQDQVKNQTTTASQTTNHTTTAKPTTTTPSVQKKGYIWPTQGKATSSSNALTIAAPRSAPVVASQAGTVIHSGNVSGYGNTVIVRHNDGLVSVYGYNDSVLVKKGDKVSRGQVISRVGSSGSATSPSLRFELRKGKQTVNPYDYLGK
ncbi:MAG: peptidoglycan DD-metalloendopeptidase family protein [Alphaproteobacteria bacterium]